MEPNACNQVYLALARWLMSNQTKMSQKPRRQQLPKSKSTGLKKTHYIDNAA
jgi:hypothetical protein